MSGKERTIQTPRIERSSPSDDYEKRGYDRLPVPPPAPAYDKLRPPPPDKKKS
jgi:hypothetical protein